MDVHLLRFLLFDSPLLTFSFLISRGITYKNGLEVEQPALRPAYDSLRSSPAVFGLSAAPEVTYGAKMSVKLNNSFTNY